MRHCYEEILVDCQTDPSHGQPTSQPTSQPTNPFLSNDDVMVNCRDIVSTHLQLVNRHLCYALGTMKAAKVFSGTESTVHSTGRTYVCPVVYHDEQRSLSSCYRPVNPVTICHSVTFSQAVLSSLLDVKVSLFLRIPDALAGVWLILCRCLFHFVFDLIFSFYFVKNKKQK